MRPVIHGSRGPEDRRKKTGRPEDGTTSNPWIQRTKRLDRERMGEDWRSKKEED
jgi:hypothetical protein